MKSFLPAVAFCAAISLMLGCRPSDSTQSAEKTAATMTVDHSTMHDMTHAATDFLASLDEEQKAKATFSFDDEERFNWNFVPMVRKGLPLEEMNEEQRQKAKAMLATVLSDEGYDKASSIMQLEEVLRVIEGHEPGNRRRNTELYYVAVFGSPSDETPWGWRYEGHHLSLNFSSVTQQVVSTPFFMGTNPAIVRSGEKQGTEVLKKEQDMGRALVKSLSFGQKSKAMISSDAPEDIITGTSRKASLEAFEGLPYSEMTPEQQSALTALLNVYLDNAEQEIADARRAEIEAAGYENIHFAWAGGLEPGDAHYYRIHGPTILVEYDNIQNDANHIHTTLRDFNGDFGEDLLKKHYEESDHH